jgi:hypothetical protein
MRISNPLLIGIFIILFIAFNAYIIPQQRRVQLEIDKKATWEIPTTIDLSLDYALLGPNSLIQSVSTELEFQLQSFDIKTGELMRTKVFADEMGSPNEIVCIGNALYIAFTTDRIYKLDATTLEVLWKTNWNLGSFNRTEVNIEQSKDLILISSFNRYSNFYSFIKQETGELYHEKVIDKELIVKNPIKNLFMPFQAINWGAYYNFKNNQLIFNTTKKFIQFIEDDYLVDINDSLSLSSFTIESQRYTYKKNHKRSDLSSTFISRKEALYLKNKVTGAFSKRITNIQASTQSIIFLLEQKENSSYPNNIPIVDYVFIGKTDSYSNFNVQNIASTPQAYVSGNYFIALDPSNSQGSHQEILLVDLSHLRIKQSFYVPFDQVVLKLFCDQNQIYALVQKPDEKTYWIVVPIAS